MVLEKVAKHILLPLYFYKTKNRALKRLSVLEKSQYLDAETMRAQQLSHLKKLLRHCHENVPFYRRRFETAGFNPLDFKDFEDLKHIPYLSKKDLQDNLDTMVAGNFDRSSLIVDSSGGSTGRPTNFYRDLRRNTDAWADQVRHDRWSGWDLGEKCVKLWGAQREFEEQFSFRYRMVEKHVHRAYIFNAFDVSEEKIVAYLAELKKIRPTMILAYANVAYLFSTIIEKRGVDLSGLRLKGVICSAETLTERMRSAIEAAFCCKVLNRYGSREVGVIASECLEQNGLHINSDSVYVEVEEGGRGAMPDELGEIVVTDLWNYGMPLVRYRTGDVGAMSSRPCGCARNLPTLKRIEGRVSDFLDDSKGGLVHGEFFTHLFYGIREVEQFQLVQESLGHLTLRVVPGGGFTAPLLSPVISKIRQCLGTNVVVEVEICASSFVEASGKFRFTISKIPNRLAQQRDWEHPIARPLQGVMVP